MLINFVYFSLFPSMISLNILKIGSRTNLQNPRTSGLPSCPVPSFLDHLPALVSKKLLPHIFLMSFEGSVLNLLAYKWAKWFRVKAQDCRPDPKATVPLSGNTWQSPSAS